MLHFNITVRWIKLKKNRADALKPKLESLADRKIDKWGRYHSIKTIVSFVLNK